MSTFSNTINGQITITPTGDYGCGPVRGEPVTFDVTIDVEADELDHRGFVVDVFAVRQMLDYKFNGASTESGELLVQRIVDDELFSDERLTLVTATIKSADFATITCSRDVEDEDEDEDEDVDDEEDEEDDALEARTDGELDPIEKPDNDDAKQPTEPSPGFDEINALLSALGVLTQPTLPPHRQTLPQPRIIDLGNGLRAIAIPVAPGRRAGPRDILEALLGG